MLGSGRVGHRPVVLKARVWHMVRRDRDMCILPRTPFACRLIVNGAVRIAKHGGNKPSLTVQMGLGRGLATPRLRIKRMDIYEHMEVVEADGQAWERRGHEDDWRTVSRTSASPITSSARAMGFGGTPRLIRSATRIFPSQTALF
jgi:hypothetical protein